MSNIDCQLVIFDMDGTLTRPNINFDEIRAAIGISNGPILEAISKMTPAERERANAILLEFEDKAAEGSELQPHAFEVVAAVRSSGRPAALMTRNTRRSVEIVRRLHGLEFDYIRTRDDGTHKPAPDPVHDICRDLGVAPEVTWAIGDFHYDLICANAAGAVSVFLAEAFEELPDWAGEAHHVVRSLREFAELIGLSLDGQSPAVGEGPARVLE